MTVIETVTSPAGDQVDVVDDDPTVLWGPASPIVKALWNDGPSRNTSGEAARPVFEAARRRGYKAINLSAMNGLLNRSLAPYIERDISGHRTYLVRLARIPKVWLDGRLDERDRIPLTRQERDGHRSVVCPLCEHTMGVNNLHRHLTGTHHQHKTDASRLVQLARQGAIDETPKRNVLPAVVEVDGDIEPESVLNDIPAIDLMTGMLAAVRRDQKVPIRALPTLQEWLATTERVLSELAQDA